MVVTGDKVAGSDIFQLRFFSPAKFGSQITTGVKVTAGRRVEGRRGFAFDGDVGGVVIRVGLGRSQ
jgi:hypothetical protein